MIAVSGLSVLCGSLRKRNQNPLTSNRRRQQPRLPCPPPPSRCRPATVFGARGVGNEGALKALLVRVFEALNLHRDVGGSEMSPCQQGLLLSDRRTSVRSRGGSADPPSVV